MPCQTASQVGRSCPSRRSRISRSASASARYDRARADVLQASPHRFAAAHRALADAEREIRDLLEGQLRPT
ncbi:hypothetical protein, partial [Streptomyces alboverticillatus]|uniref:hypothetical protein n=1 Tax=Streptomyces alboverticillatus TaxID=173770 RepID=UPI0015C51E9A